MNEEFQRLYHLASAHITHPFRDSKEHWQHAFEHTATLNHYFTMVVTMLAGQHVCTNTHFTGFGIKKKILLFHTSKLAFAVDLAERGGLQK